MNEKRKKALIDYVVYTSIIAFGILADQLTKWLAIKYLKQVETFAIIKDVLHFTFLKNTGAAFGMLSDHRWVFMLISTVAIITLAVYLYQRRAPNMLYGITLSAIISGGIGNMIDRIYLGYVVDFIDVRLIDFAIFNIADSFVTVGSIGLIVLLLVDIVKEAREEKRKKAGKND